MIPCEFPVFIHSDDPAAVGSDGRSILFPTRCGKCPSCLLFRQRQWAIRLTDECRSSVSTHFITLTYDSANLPFRNYRGNRIATVAKKDVQDFFKKLRGTLQPTHVRYYLVSEYGPRTLRPHYHAAIFLDSPLDSKVFSKLLHASWAKGITDVRPISKSRISYVAKYHTSRTVCPDGAAPNFTLSSRRPGIGFYGFFRGENAPVYGFCTPDGGSYSGPDGVLSNAAGRSIPAYYRKFIPEPLRRRSSRDYIVEAIDNFKDRFNQHPDMEALRAGVHLDATHKLQRAFIHYKKTPI